MDKSFVFNVQVETMIPKEGSEDTVKNVGFERTKDLEQWLKKELRDEDLDRLSSSQKETIQDIEKALQSKQGVILTHNELNDLVRAVSEMAESEGRAVDPNILRDQNL